MAVDDPRLMDPDFGAPVLPLVPGQHPGGPRPTPDRLLKAALATAGCTAPWRALSARWAGIVPVSRALAGYLTLAVPALGPPRPLLGVCLTQALAGWQTLDGNQPEPACFLGYLRGLLFPLPEVLEWVCQHEGPAGLQVWNPFAEPLLRWQRRHSAWPRVSRRDRRTDSTFATVSPAELRQIVLCRFLLSGAALATLAPHLEHLVRRYG